MSINRFAFALNAPENERYVVRKGVDMLVLLRALAGHRTPVTLHFGETDERLHTELIGTNPAFEELLFAPGRDQGTLERLLAAGSFGVETTLDAIRILFIASHAEITRFQEQKALRARIPDTLTRMQRRETVRIPIPADHPSFCILRLNAKPRSTRGGGDDAESGSELRLRMADISVGGLSLILTAPNDAIDQGKTLPDCRVELPGIGLIRCALNIVYVRDEQSGGGAQRIGCRFVDLPALSREQVRSTVARLERAQLAAS